MTNGNGFKALAASRYARYWTSSPGRRFSHEQVLGAKQPDTLGAARFDLIGVGGFLNIGQKGNPVLTEKKDCGDKTVVVGGGLVGCETALHLVKKGKKVIIVEALNKILALNGPLCSANSDMLEKLIPFNNIDVKTNSKVKTYKDGILEIETENGIEKIGCNSVILSVGYKEENSLYKELEFEIPEIYILGDARRGF